VTRGQSTTDGKTGRDALEAARRTFIAAMKRGDFTALAALYAEDAIVVPQTSEIRRGSTAIRKFFRNWLSSTKVREFEVTTEDLRLDGNTAYTVGTYRMSCEDASGERISDEGKYLIVYERGPNGEWRIARDMSSSNRG
jgi:uncharacterized protein (TIGR02246 family)